MLLYFSAGPPYEDIAFRIVNREWEFSHKRWEIHNLSEYRNIDSLLGAFEVALTEDASLFGSISVVT